MIKNDKEVSAALKALETTTGKGGKKVVFQDVDYNVLSFEEQIQIDLQTDIMVGPHGAGLMHNIFMRDRATLIELFVDGSSVNRHFHNLANW
jgi:capsular polysaccharide biosynthesis protein